MHVFDRVRQDRRAMKYRIETMLRKNFFEKCYVAEITLYRVQISMYCEVGFQIDIHAGMSLLEQRCLQQPSKKPGSAGYQIMSHILLMPSKMACHSLANYF